MKKRGLFIIAGSAGSGKTTSIASIIDHRNTNGTGHIVILEDPIEYYHKNKNAIITQREIGIDTYSYGIALKNAFRQRPDVVVIGEVRDRETIDNAILFCETGHLVLTTIHSNNANHAIERIINMYPEAAQKQILYTLASNLNGIVSQRIIPGIKRSKVLAYEIMINRGLIRNYIEEGAVMKIKALMEKGNQQGMVTFDQNLYELVKKGAITKEEAMINADNPGNFALKFNNEKFSRLVRDIDENEQDKGNEF
jgi:twitching motility protein PilU